jgi:hypothetical protein
MPADDPARIGYQHTRRALLLWCAVSFFVLTLSYLLDWVDLVLIPNTEWYTYRLATTLLAMIILLVGLIWEVQ